MKITAALHRLPELQKRVRELEAEIEKRKGLISSRKDLCRNKFDRNFADKRLEPKRVHSSIPGLLGWNVAEDN